MTAASSAIRFCVSIGAALCLASASAADPIVVTGSVVDSFTKRPIPCRLYVQNLDTKEWHFAKTTAEDGSAVAYRKEYPATRSVEVHTTLSAHPFQLELPPGRYAITVEHGKEYLPSDTRLVVDATKHIEIPLTRFTNMADIGWYSGDTHVHRKMDELPNLMLAEDLNVAMPLNYWVRDSREIPSASGPVLEPAVIEVDPTCLIYPINTEYEIFTVDGKRHTQGAVFVLNHKTPLNLPAPPTLPVAEEARRQGALLDLDKHSWAWSMMIIPVMNVDLFELSNNHNWRTSFGFPQWTIENAPDWPEVERNEAGFTERGWTEFAMQTYYALLNCGYRLRVTGGTGAGVHPVPLGHGRVYVFTGAEFSYESWIKGLNDGHSFVTTGPLVDVRFDHELPGQTWERDTLLNTMAVSASISSVHRLKSVELIVNGQSIPCPLDASEQLPNGSWSVDIYESVALSGSSWVALRCFEDLPDGKISFAHTNPVFVDVAGHELKPRPRDAAFFVQRMDEEIVRNTGILPDESLAEYRRAKEMYEAVLKRAMAER